MADGENPVGAPDQGLRGTRPYAAFISYSHADEEVGDWLHRRLEGYQVPPPLIGRTTSAGTIRKRLGKVFRDRAELSAAHDLGAEIRRALEDSEALIVLCSPRSCGSRYVAEEIATFKRLGKGDRIFAAIVDGEPHAAGKPGKTAAEECFPAALIYRLDARGQLTNEVEPNEPIAADFRDGKDGQENGSLKLIAGLIGVGLDELVQREKQAERRRRLRANAIALAMAVLALAAMGAGLFAWVKQDEALTNFQLAEERAEAERAARAEAESNARERDRQRGIAVSEAERARIQELAAIANAREASAQRDAARNALARIFAERSRQAIESDNHLLAARYALAGLRISPANEQEYRQTLARLVHDTVESRPIPQPVGAVARIALSPDGQRFVTGSRDGRARIWRTSGEGEPLVLSGHTGEITHIEYSVDGAHVLTGSYVSYDSQSVDWTARVWDARTGRLIQTFGGVADPLRDAHFIGRDGRVVTASRDGVVRVLNAESGAETLVLRGANELRKVEASADGSRIYAEFAGGDMKVWDANGVEQLSMPLTSDGTISPDGTQVATSGSEIAIVNVDGGDSRATWPSQSWGGASMSFSPNGELVAAFGFDVGVRIWNARTGAVVATLPAQSRGFIFAFSPDGRLAVTGSQRGDAYVWEVASGRRIATLRGHFSSIMDVAFDQRGTTIVTASIDGTVRVWPLSGLRAVATLHPGDGVVDAALDATGSRLFAVTNNGAPLGSEVRVWDAQTLRPLTADDSLERAFGLADSGAGIIAFDFRDSRREGAAVGFDVFTRRPVVDLRRHESQITGVEYSRDGRFIVTSTMEGAVRVWRPPTEHIATLAHDDYVGDAAFNHDGTQIVTASTDGAVRLWRASDPERRSWSISATLRGHRSGLSQARFSADGRYIVSASSDHTARIWDASTGRLLKVLSGHEEAVNSASFSQSGEHVLTASEDGTARLWDASSGRTIVVLGDLGFPVRQARFGSNDTKVILATEFGVQVWDVSAALSPTPRLAAGVCSWLLLPMTGSRTFLATEVEADPLVRDVWLADQASERDVCEGVPGIPPITLQPPQLTSRAQ